MTSSIYTDSCLRLYERKETRGSPAWMLIADAPTPQEMAKLLRRLRMDPASQCVTTEISSSSSAAVKTQRRLGFYNVSWTHLIASELILTLQHFVNTHTLSRKKPWEEILFVRCTDQPGNCYFQSILETVRGSQIFRKVTIDWNRSPLPNNFAICLAELLQRGACHKICLKNISLDSATSALLAEGLRPGMQPMENVRSLQFSSCDWNPNHKFEVATNLARGFRMNTTLQELNFEQNGLEDGPFAVMMDGIASGESLRVFKCREDNLSSPNALHSLLASRFCRIHELRVSGRFSLIQMAQGLPQNTSLRKLILIETPWVSFTVEDIAVFMQNMWKLTHLQSFRLQLSLGKMTHSMFRQLSQAMIETTLNQNCNQELEELHFVIDGDNGWMARMAAKFLLLQDDESLQVLRRLVQAFPKLHTLEPSIMRSHNTALEAVLHTLDMRRIGVGDKWPNLPLSAWPYALAQAQSEEFLKGNPRRSADVLYHLLKGPAFAGRGNLENAPSAEREVM